MIQSGTDGGYNPRPPQGGWGGPRQDRGGDRGRGRWQDRGGRGPHYGGGRDRGGWDRQQPVPPGTGYAS